MGVGFAEPPGARSGEACLQRLEAVAVECGADGVFHDPQGFRDGQGSAVGAVAGEGVVEVAGGDDPGLAADRRSVEAERVACAVELLVMLLPLLSAIYSWLPWTNRERADGETAEEEENTDSPREKMLKDQLEEMRKRNPKITETFADLKRDIREMMSLDDWEVSLASSPETFLCQAVHWFS